MEMTRLEAIDIFRGWLSEGAWLRCVFEFSRFTAFLRGRVVEVSEESIRILSDDTFSELALGLDSVWRFGYGEPRAFPEEAKVLRRSIVADLSPAGAETISLEEIIE